MAIPSKQIGGSVNYNLLWQISKQLERLIEVRSNINASTSTSSSTTTTTTTLDPNLIPIGTQIWTIENFDGVTYRDGTPIPQITDPAAWAALTTGAWCYYNNDPANELVYGKLYNWYAVAGIDGSGTPRILAPVGYHVPTDAEWTTLTNYLGGTTVEGNAGGKMKATGTTLWQSPNAAATNSSGFTGLPGGIRNLSGTFSLIGSHAWWWSSSGFNTTFAWHRYLLYYDGLVTKSNGGNKKTSMSVRLIKD